MGLTRHKISDREPCKAGYAAKGSMANMQKVDRMLARGSLHRLVRRFVADQPDRLISLRSAAYNHLPPH
jgi:hypothetical protein